MQLKYYLDLYEPLAYKGVDILLYCPIIIISLFSFKSSVSKLFLIFTSPFICSKLLELAAAPKPAIAKEPAMPALGPALDLLIKMPSSNFLFLY